MEFGWHGALAKNVWADNGGFEVCVMVGGITYRARMPRESTLQELKAKRAELGAQGHTDRH